MKLPSRLARFIRELRRRRVLQAAAVYATGAFVAVQAAGAVLPPLRAPEWTHTLVVVVAVAGFPVVVALWWAFEITPEGIQRTVEREEQAEVMQARGTPWMALALVVVVTVASAGLGWATWDLWLDPGSDVQAAGDGSSDDSPLPTHRVAVLPFEDGSADGRLEQVAAGLNRDLTHHLSQIDVLDMVSSLGTRQHARSDLPSDSIARALGAGSLVQGTLEPMGERVRLRIQLVDGPSGETQLSSELSAPRDSVLLLRDDLVAEAVRQLRRRLGEEIELERIRGSTPSGEAWKSFHEAEGLVQRADSLRYYATELARSFYDRADSLYLEARDIDDDWLAPRLARGWLMYKRARLRSRRIDQTDPEWLRSGIEIANGILMDRPASAAALELRGVLRSWLYLAGAGDSLQRTLRHAEEDLSAAVTRDQDRARAWVELAEVLRAQGRFEEARTAWNEARAADAFLRNDADVLRLGSHLALELGDFETALEWGETEQRRYPSSPHYPELRLLIYPMEGAPRVSVDSLWSVLREFEERAGGEQPYAHLWVAAALARYGRGDSARSVLDRILAATDEGGRPYVAYFAPKVWLNLGDTARALRGLEEALDYELWSSRKTYVARDIWWKPLHGDSTFQALVAGGSR